MNIQNNKIITLTKDVKNLISASQQKAIRAVDFERVLLYWNIGKRIYEEVQGGDDRAEYGKAIIKNLSDELEPTYGSGYSYRQLYLFLQFHKVFPIVNALRSQLSWTQYKLLLRIEDSDKREFYIAESTKNNWSSRELKRQINASLYKRLLLSNDKKSVLEVARNEKLPTHQDIGQLQMYVNYFDRVEKQEFENPTIGVLPCADKNDTVVKYTLPKENKTILASKYQLYLPSEEELIKELHRELEEQKRGL